MKQKPKQHHKSKEELLFDEEKKAKFVEKMAFIKDKFYPALCNASKNIEDAMSFLSSINSIMMEIFLKSMQERKLGELNLTSKLDPKDEKYEQLKEMLLMFDDMTIFDAKAYFEGMRSEIQLFCNDELKDRTLSTLKTRWIDETKQNG